MRTWQNVKKKKKKKKKIVRKVFMLTPLNDERAVNTITYLRLNVYESFSVSMSQYVYKKNQDNC